MTLTCVACYGVPEAEYQGEYMASGRVVDPENNPIQGIKVSVEEGYRMYTDISGSFFISTDIPRLYIDDVDGEENGGEYESQQVDLTEQAYDLGDIVLTPKK